jgi:hypothetical protein
VETDAMLAQQVAKGAAGHLPEERERRRLRRDEREFDVLVAFREVGGG